MKLTYTLTTEDLIAFNVHNKSRGSLLAKLFKNGIFLAAYGYIIYSLRERSVSWEVIGIFVGISVIAFLLTKRFVQPVKWAITKTVEQDPSLIGERTIELGQKGILYTTPKENTRLMWDDLNAIEENKRYFFIYTDKNIAFFFPKQSLYSEAQVVEVKRLLEQGTGKKM
ncbi:MAG: YcxB family protein [Bacteroidota bacterium]